MLRILSYILAVLTFFHGLAHLPGFLAYWPLTVIPDLPYKTTLLGGRLDLGAAGIRVFSGLWLVAALIFIAAAVALALRRASWTALMLAGALLSLALCVLDWQAAFIGGLVNIALLVLLLVVFGFRAQPAPLAPFTGQPGPVETLPIPQGLPEPVERFYRLRYGERIPVYHSAVISGRGTIRFMDIPMASRIRFIHDLQTGYRHYIETTFYGVPLFKVNEHYLDGKSRFELPFGVIENEPKQNSAANQGFWSEFIAYPAVYVTDPRARWEAVESSRANLIIPFEGGEQVLTVTFDPASGQLSRIETMRYRDVKGELIRWWGDIRPAKTRAGGIVPEHWEITWEDMGIPWLVADVEELVLNPDVSETIRQKGE